MREIIESSAALSHVANQDGRRRAKLSDATILGLLCWRRPSTVSGLVPFAILDAIELVPTRRLWPHVREESLERIAPLFAHGDATFTVEPVILVGAIEATTFCGFPRTLFYRKGHG